MLFEPYTRTGTLNRLDADSGAMCGSPTDVPSTCFHNRNGLGWTLALGAWMLLLPVSLAGAQAAGTASTAGSSPSTETSTAKPSVHHAVHHHHHHHAKPAAAIVAPEPAAPPPPLPPAEQPANPATVDFNHGLLTVRAQNSSLISILDQIQHQTGLVIEGLNHDQRMYGQYGPGNISTTLTALLDGSGYDFVIVGAGSDHAAARLILSTPDSSGVSAITPPAVANNQQAKPAEANPNEVADPTAAPQPKTPQEIFNEMRRMHPQ
ncbi:MAG TPA: hypothetical protein VMF56_04145 [Acidobacteriaceae bacterium]|nr:hypothetical protein [Acidobacteriaceae bacterium]